MVLASKRNVFSTIGLIALLLTFSTCKKDKNKVNGQFIPATYVNFSKNLDLPDMSPLQVPGGWVYVVGGSKGIILYRYSPDQINAYERHSPYNSDLGCQVYIPTDNQTIALDTCSMVTYQLNTGNVSEGPGTQNLYQYFTEIRGNILYVQSYIN